MKISRSFVLSVLTLVSLHASIVLADEKPGLLVKVPESSLTMIAPKGWTQAEKSHSQSLVFEDKRNEGPKKPGEIKFTPNMTVAVMHKGYPIDELELDVVTKKLEKDFGEALGVNSYRILESRFIDYRGKSDAILVYADFKMGDIPMNQMHVFLSGSKEAALLTYTQLEKDFGSEQYMEEIWQSMMSIEIEGQAPYRYSGLVQAGIFAGILSVFASLLHVVRRRRQRQMVDTAERSMDYDDDDDDFERETWKASATKVARQAYATDVARPYSGVSLAANQ